MSEDEGRQAVSYAYHRKIKFAVVTNFKYIRVYHALSNIKNVDKNLLFWLEFKDLEKDFEKLWLLSKESFEKQEINKLLSKKDEKQFVPVDESILYDLLEIRRLLSNDLKKLRMYLTDEKIDESIQILIDRLIFIRSVEDRGLENQNFLLGLVKDSREGRLKKKLWYILQDYFKEFDNNYNSKLFASGSILEDEKNVFFDDSTLEKTIRILYFGEKEQQSRYMFDEIPGDLLGSIYEQYLGVVLRGTEKRVKLESESGKRKKMGIYYTPSYIVDYIVKNTVGEYIKDKTIDEILDVNIVDPACGSGSFLIRAFQEVCNIIEQKLKNGEKAKHPTFKNYEGRLNLAQKNTILSRCIHGVDLDEKAVELSQLNLLLRLLEGETRATRKLLLPNLKDNIKNGNSLIDDSGVAGEKAFNWNAQFPDVFRNGGFDIVIGNPPYNASLNDEEDKLIKNKYAGLRSGDTAEYFFKLSLDISLKAGFVGLIIPKSVAYYERWAGIRQILLKNNRISNIADVGLGFFDVNLEEIIIIIEKDHQKISDYKIKVDRFSDIKRPKDVKTIVMSEPVNFSLMEKNNILIFYPLSKIEQGILNKIDQKSIKVSEVIKEAFRGLYISDKDKEKLKKGQTKFISKEPWIQRYGLKNLTNINIDSKIMDENKVKRVLQKKLIFKVLREKD